MSTSGTMPTRLPAIYDGDEVRRALDLILALGQVTELRILDGTLAGDRWTGTYFGFFDDPAKLVEALQDVRSAKGIYIIPNAVNPALLARCANRIRRAGKGDATSDSDIIRRRWLLIDCDPIRPANINAALMRSMGAAARPGKRIDAITCGSKAGPYRSSATAAMVLT